MTGQLHCGDQSDNHGRNTSGTETVVLLAPIEGSVSWREGNVLRPDQQDFEGIGFQTTYNFLS